jgi:RHS repeat-associated protein
LLIAESTSTGTIKAEYIYLNGQSLAKIEWDNIYYYHYYYHNDHLGTPMFMTDESQNIVWEGEFLPFGEAYSVTGSITNNFRFPGQYYDEETGLHYNYFRDYKPEIGRYIEADPIGIDRGRNHLYVYVKNSPLNRIDPLGLIGVPIDPFGRGRTWCAECDWEKLAQCIAQVYDRNQIETCKTACEAAKTIPPPHKWTAVAACVTCLVGKSYEVLDCFKQYCIYKRCCGQ